MKRVELYYDFSCPYAYLGHTQIEALCDRGGAELTWRPFLLGGVFRAIGTVVDERSPGKPGSSPGPTGMPIMPAAKALHNLRDMMRWADHWGVPLRMPDSHPNRTVLALRAAIASGDLPRASKALFAAYWARALDVSRPEVVSEALSAAGLDGAQCVERAGEPAIKDDLRQRTDEAIGTGVFGAPTFVVTAPGVKRALFWGQDRLHFVEKTLGGWIPPEAER